MDAAEIQKRMRAHWVAFGAMVVLALLASGTVVAGKSSGNIIFAITLAQAAIILVGMMHARTEGLWVRGVLLFAAFFVAALVGLMALGHSSTIVGTERIQSAPATAPVEMEAH